MWSFGINVSGIIFVWRNVGEVGIDMDVPVVLAGRGEGAVCEVGVVGSAVSPDSDGVILQGVGEKKPEVVARDGECKGTLVWGKEWSSSGYYCRKHTLGCIGGRFRLHAKSWSLGHHQHRR